MTTLSSKKKAAVAKAKEKKASSKTSSKKPTKTSQTQRSQPSIPSHSQTSTQVSISDIEPTHNGSIFDADSEYIMEPSDGEEDKKGTAENPMEMSDGLGDEEEEVGKTHLNITKTTS
jgi:hypothetical protein